MESMKLRTHDRDGRLVRIRIDEHAVRRYDQPEIDPEPVAHLPTFDDEGNLVSAPVTKADVDDDEEDDEGSETQNVILVEPLPNTMTVEGAISGIGLVAHKLSSDPHAASRAWDSSAMGWFTRKHRRDTRGASRRRSRKQWFRLVVRTVLVIASVSALVLTNIHSWVR